MPTDYWNLHSGAEMGLYVYDQNYSGTDHYYAVDFTVPMSLSLYYYKGGGISTVFNWSPTADQWWVTGFSGQNQEFLYPDENQMVTVGTIDLSQHTALYDGLYKKYNSEINYYTMLGLELIFDGSSHTVWVNWYEGVSQ